MLVPLAEKIRPEKLSDVIGQRHILGEGMPLRGIIESGYIPNMLFYGSAGIGKTTVARLIAKQTKMTMHRLNGTSASVSDIREIMENTKTLAGIGGILLYLDEIQYLNKKQQQSLLEYMEDGRITLIAATTENPYFYVYGAILSRLTVFEFKPLTPDVMSEAVRRAFDLAAEEFGVTPELEDGVTQHIAAGCGGDVRKCVNTVEMCVLARLKGAPMSPENQAESRILKVSLETAKLLTQKSSMRYDKKGDEHYDILSAFQKSIRGSDENAALHYAARLIEAGDIISLCRRLMTCACEDIGLAYPTAITVVNACVEAANRLGLPEARIPIADAIVLLCTAPKSNSAYLAMDAALDDIRSGNSGPIPRHLQNVHLDSAEVQQKGQHYLYPHDFPNHYTPQQYLPDNIKDRVYYKFGTNKSETAALNYRNFVIGAAAPNPASLFEKSETKNF
ncbi:MAG: replication-associated recombination protein A [Oscillospiraceae bacterium]|nr:replication-associated recombination protein A [Oscillospiraceae bacterium]